MLRLISALAVLVALCPPAAAQSVIDSSADGLDEATRAAVVALATRGLAEAESAELRNIHQSLARNGMGYCGEVSVAAPTGGEPEFTVFHAILGGEGSLLRLSDYPPEATNTYYAAVTEMLHNFGCIE